MIKKSPAIFSFVVSAFIFTTASAQFNQVPDEVEYQALKDLYDSTNGAGWTNNTNWLNGETAADFGSWYGVTVQNGDIVRIVINNNNLSGSVPASIGDLKKLYYLFIGDNKKLSGSIPPAIGTLTDLTYLYLGNSSLWGPIPESFSALTKMQHLFLHNSNLTGRVPEWISTFKDLRRLYIGNAGMEGYLPDSFRKLTRLNRLSIANLPLNGPLPEWIQNFRNLELFYAPNCGLTGEIPEWIGNLTGLHWLYLYENNLQGALPESFSRLTNLGFLYLYDNQLEGTFPEYFGSFHRLTRLYIHENRFNGDFPASVKNITSLYNVNISSNAFSSFPDYSSVSHAPGLIVQANFNKLKFEHLESNFTSQGRSVFKNLDYQNQSPMAPDTIASSLGQSVLLNAEDNAPHNRYQWQKLVNGSWTNIPNATAGTHILDSIAEGTSYRCRITNDWVTNLTIFSKTFVIQTTSEFYSVADGNWTTDRIWSTTKGGSPVTGYPRGGSKVFIVGNNVTISDDISCGPLEVIVENSGASLTVDGAELTVNGEVRLKKTTEGYPGNVKVVNGGKIKPVDL